MPKSLTLCFAMEETFPTLTSTPAFKRASSFQPEHPDTVAAIEKVHRQSARAGKPAGMVDGSREQARFWMERGFHFFTYGEPSSMVRSEASRIVREMQELHSQIRQNI